MKRRMVSILTALALVLSLCPTWAFATEADPALCKHHLEHTEDCGYIAHTEGQPCGHEHGDECYSEETVCGHDHDESCYSDGQLPAEGEDKAADTCTHTCSAESGCVTRTLDCQHVHNEECGYVEADPGTPCEYGCHICPIEALIGALPDKVTEENRADVEARLQEILSLFSDLTEEEQEQIDISRCLELQEALDEASVPELMADDVVQVSGDITIDSSHNGKTLTSNGDPQKGSIIVNGITVSLTISDLDLEGTSRSAIVLENGANLTLNLQGTNNLEGGGTAAGIKVLAGCTLTITGETDASLRVLGGDGAAGIGASVYNGGSTGTVQTVGTIIINSGNITATGLGGGPGIGGTVECTTGDVIINGGNITASGSSGTSFFGAAGIGAGYVGHLNSITITGGTVKATGMSRDGVSMSKAVGIGAGPYPLSGSSVPIGCGDIRITGGTIRDTTIGFDADDLANKMQSGSITIEENVDLPGCSVKPMPKGWNSYTFNFKVFDTSITDGETPAQFVVRGRTYDVTIQRDASQPYCGAFSLKDVLLPVDGSDEVQLILNGKTLTKTVSFSNTTVNADFGVQEHAYYSLDITIYDEKITGNLDATVQIGEQTVTGRLNKTVEYCGTMTIERIILPIDLGDEEQEVTVTAGGNTWTGTASAGRSKTLTIGSPIQPAQASFDLSYGDITFEGNGGAVTVTYHDGAEAKTYQLTDLSKVYEVTQSNAGTATANRLIIQNMSEPVHIRIKDINIATETNSPIDITNGKAILETSGTNTVTASGENFAGVHVGSGSELTLAGTGQLTAKSTHSTYSGAGIGSDKGEASGKIVIQSGTVIAESAMYGAGIGSGRSGSGTVTIDGGTVTATGGSSSDGLGGGAAIGGGSGGFGTVTINGGTVTATCNGGGNGIGGGSSAGANVTISGGTVYAKSGDRGSGIGGSGQSSRIDIHISGGIITADATSSSGGSGIGSGMSGTATIKITGGTIKASAPTSGSNNGSGIGSGRNGSATVTITGGTIQASGKKSAVENPKDENSTALSLVTITLDGVGDNVPVTGVSGTGSYGCKDVYTRDGGKLYFYLPENTRPEKITAGGVDYVPESEGSTKYVVDFQVSFTGYELTKEYDGTPMQKPTTNQVTSNGVNLTFAWYQGETPITAPVNAGSYTLQVSSDKGSKDFGVEITKRLLTITASSQTIDYGGSIAQDAYTSSGLAAGDTLTVTLAASETTAGTHTGAITISSVDVTRDSADVTENYTITKNAGALTIRKAVLTVNSWPTAAEITYGQALGDSVLAGENTNGTFAWKDGAVKPSAGTAEYDVIFTPTDPNYEAVTGKVSVTVKKAALTVKANNQTITYGGSIQTDLAQVTAAPVNGDTLTAVQVSASASARDVGTYTGGITVTGAKIGNNGTDVTANYEISYGAGDLTISPLTITVTPDSGQSKEYGADDPVLTYTVTPALIGDDKLTGALTRAVGDNVGDYEIIQGTLAAGNNYALTVTSGVKFAITKPSLENAVVTLDNASFTYDGTAKTPAVTVTKGGAAVAANEYDISYSNSNGGAGNHTNAGTVTVTVTARADGNYSGFNSTATFTIAPKELTPKITGAATKTYDGGTTCDGRGLSITLDGLLEADTGNVTATASYVYADKNVGTDKTINASGITLDGASKDNYVLSKTTATANVGMIIRATVNIIWGSESQTMTYNGTQATITEPTVSAESGVTVSVSPKYSYAAQDSTDFKDGLPINAGTYTVRASIAESDNLTAAQADTTLTINKAALTVSGATIKSKSYDTTKTATVSGVTFTGLKNGEMLALGTDYTATGTFADANVGEGKSVTVTVTLADTAKANNYNLTPNTTTATADITKANPVVTDVSVSSPDPIYESASLDSITLTHGAGDTAGTVALDPSQTLTVGTKGYAWTFTPTDTDNYNTATGTISLTVAVDALQSIAVTTPPTKTTYTYGESFDKAGMVITAIYASGATKVVTGEVQISPAELTVTTTELTITYQGKTVTQAITVGPKEVTNPTIELSPTTFVYDGAEKKPAVTVKDGEKVIPADEYTVEYSNNTNVGTTATVTITDKTGGNYTVSGTTTFTITAKPLTGAKVETTGTFTYTGNALTPAPTVTLDGKTLTENTDYTVAYDKNTDAGTATITVTGKGNYSGTAQGTFTIGRATLTADGTGTASGTYGDKLSELTVSGLTAKLGEATVTGTWKLAGGTVPNVGDSGEYTATFTPATSADNYNALEAKVTLTIAQATAPTPQTGTLNVQNGHAREYTYDLSRLLPVLASGQSFGGEVTYTLKTVNITEAGYYDIDTAAISGTTLTLPVKAVTSSDEGQIGTITVTLSSKNFADVDATINVKRVNKQPVSIEGVTAQNGTYNGESHNGYTGTPTASPYNGGFTTTYATADGTALSGPPTNAGDYTVTFSLNPNDTYTGSRTLSFTIAKASITITADDKRADVGTAKPALTYTVTGLVSGDTLATAPTLTCDADMNTIGQYPITASGAAVPSGGNYNTAITYVPGTLNVTDPTIPVTGVTLNKTSTTLTVGGSERLTATVTPSDATDKSVTWASSNTAVATADANGTVTAVSAGTATITVTTADGAKTATCTVTVRTNSSGGGGGGGGGGTTTSPTVTVPVSGDKGTVHVSASVSGTTATVSKIDTSQIENVIGDNGQASMVEIDFTGLGKTIDTVKLPAAAIKDIAAKSQNEEVRGLTVKLPEAEISFDANALSAIQAQAGSQITLAVTPAKPADLNSRQKEAVGSAPVFDLTLRSSSGAITDFRGGYATVSLPYTLAAGQNPSGVVVYYLDSTGNITPCTTMYDVRSKSAIFTTGHLSLYFVGYDPAAVWVNPFSDVAGDAWYYDAVRYASENGLMGGYGNGMFGPNDNLSRAQFAQILFNKEGRPIVNYLLRYNDVADGAWYTEAVRWATSQGVVSGYGNGMFGPNDNITREQLAVMLWRYAGSPAATDKELHFTDTDKASGFALEALRWAVENGVMGGYGDGRLDPKGLATRAQVAQMLKNYLEK